MERLTGKVALVTGGASGIGRSFVERLAREGASVVAADVDERGLTNLVDRFSNSDDRGDVVSVHTDVRSSVSVEAAVRCALDTFSGLDIVCANAGIARYGRVWEIDEADWQAIMDVDLLGAWQTVKAAAPPMIEQGRGGSIIFTSSVLGLTALPGMAHYVAAKHGVVGLMKSCALELAEHRIRVNAVCPGSTDTPIDKPIVVAPRADGTDPRGDQPAPTRGFSHLHKLPVRMLPPDAISDAMLYLASDESKFVTGVSLPVEAGFMLP